MGLPLSIRLSDELLEEFKILSDQTGIKQEDFVATLLAAFKERQVETDTGSPVYREKAKVTQALAQIERVVGGFLEIAHNDKETQVQIAQEQVGQLKVEVSELKEFLKESKLQHQETSQRKTTLEEKVSILEEQVKSLKALRVAWIEKESILNSRIADLDTEVSEARKIKPDLIDATTKIIELKNKVALVEEQGISDQGHLTDIKTRLQGKNTALGRCLRIFRLIG